MWCPELRGCITQGKTKREAFDNLLFAISEVLIVSYDELGINPLTFPVTPLPLYSHIEFPNTMFGHSIGSSFTRNLFDEYQFEKIYIGERHFILTKGDDSAIGLTFLFDGINDLTKYCFDQVIEKTIRSVK